MDGLISDVGTCGWGESGLGTVYIGSEQCSVYKMDGDWESDGLDEALASVAALAEANPPPNTEPYIDLCRDSSEDLNWQHSWETQNLHNGLFSTQSNELLDYGKPGQQVDFGPLSPNGSECESRPAPVSSSGASNQQLLGFSEHLRGPGVAERENTNPRGCDVPDSGPPRKQRRILGELCDENKSIHQENGEEEVSEEKEDMGGASPSGALGAAQTHSVRWRNGVFNGRSLRELFGHCNGVVSGTHRLIHDILPDPDGRRVDHLLEQLSTTRKSNGLWIVSVHRRDGRPNQLVLPGTLASQAESIELAKTINDQYGNGPDRHAHIIHVCPWASNYCRCKPLQGLPIKRRSRPSKPWRCISEQHFVNIVEYVMREPRQLCLFEIGCSPVDITLPTGKTVETSRRPDAGWEPIWPTALQVYCPDFVPEQSTSTSSAAASNQRDDYEPAPVEAPKRRSQDATVNSIQSFLKQICVSPPKSSCRTLEWVNGPVGSYSAVDTEYNLAVRRWKTELCYWTFDDFCHHYDVVQPNPVFVPMTQYLSVPESMVMLERILEIQTNGQTAKFVNEVFQVMEKFLPKKSCIYILSPPSSGKNYVFDAIRTFYLNTGQMGNFNRNTSFPFQDCDSRRVILWNEPNIERSQYETVKMLLGGDTLSVNKKCVCHTWHTVSAAKGMYIFGQVHVI